METGWTLTELLGPDTTLDALVGRPVDHDSVELLGVGYDVGSPATGGLLRVRGVDADDEPWSFFVKILQHVRHWPLLPMLPAGFAEQFAAEFPWRGELDAWESDFADRLPDEMRLPILHRLVDLGDDRLAMWMEDVVQSEAPWTLDRYARAARMLGRLAAAGSTDAALAACPLATGFAMRMWAERALPMRGFAPLADDELWATPNLADHADLRADLIELSRAVPALLDTLDALPQAMPHGDASPQNLLVPADEPDTFVVIDISFQSPLPLGYDLGQLLVGLIHAGMQAAIQLPAVHLVILDAYLAGLEDEGLAADRATVELGYVGSLLIRSGFTSLPYERLADPHIGPSFAERVALTRFIAEHAKPLTAQLAQGAARDPA